MDWKKLYRKAITFSYDDGIEQDLPLLQILRDYGLKGTFNLNTGLDYNHGTWQYGDLCVHRLNLEEHKKDYAGQEIAVHGRLHQNLTELSAAEIQEELGQDAAEITRIFGTRPVGMAYAYGVYQERVLEEVRKLGLRYGRGVVSTHRFDLQADLLQFQPTCHHDDPQLFQLAEQFLNSDPTEPQIFYIWGHSYELEGKNHWDYLKRFCEKISGREDIFYGTNREVLLGV